MLTNIVFVDSFCGLVILKLLFTFWLISIVTKMTFERVFFKIVHLSLLIYI